MSAVTCVVCTRREPRQGWVCDGCRTRLRAQLTDLPRLLAALAVELVPTQAVAGEKVSTSRTGSPTGARLDVLALTGPGAETVSDEAVAAMLHPLVRRWSTTRTVTIIDADRVEQRIVRDWHCETVLDAEGRPVLAASNDQHGLLPPVEWLDVWARTWRRHFGHSTAPATTVRQRRRPGLSPRTAMLRCAATPALAEVTAVMVTVVRAWRRHAANTVLGLGGYQPPTDRPADPLAYEWDLRWGERRLPADPGRSIGYLTTWLDAACDNDVGIRDFAAELRALTGELGRVTGETPDLIWLGRCPTRISDPDNHDDLRTCGAPLWQDPYKGRFAGGVFVQEYPITCPRCHTTWGPKHIELHRLARDIRRAWPLDRRRRYTRDEAEQLPHPPCPGCGRRVQVKWRNVTGRRDRGTWWTLEKITCPGGCAEAERVA